MSLSPEDYAWLSKDSYIDPKQTDVGYTSVNLHGHQYNIFGYEASPSGFRATAYQRVDTHEIIIAFRGTDPDIKHHTLTTIQDVATDAIMVGTGVNVQKDDALTFTRQMLAKAKLEGIPAAQVTVTGHSLGGTLAEIVAWRYSLHGSTFNAYGAADLGLGIPEGGGQVIDNVLAGDGVSAGRHYGQVRTYATPTDITLLQQAGYLDGRHGVASGLRAMRLADHSIDNFAPDPGHGASVLTAANEARAHTFAAAIAQHRNELQTVLMGVHLGAQPGMPLSGVHAAAWVVEGVTTLGVATTTAWGGARDALAHEAVHAAQALDHAAHAVATQAAAMYTTTRTQVVHGAQAAEQAVAKTAHTVTMGVTEAAQAWDTLSHPQRWAHAATAMPLSSVEPATPLRLDDASHPEHTLYQQARNAVHRLDAQHQRTPDTRSDQLAAALTVAARREGIQRIDQVLLSDDASRVFAVQNHLSAFGRLAVVPTLEALNTPVAQSSATWQRMMQQMPVPPPMEIRALPPVPALGMGR